MAAELGKKSNNDDLLHAVNLKLEILKSTVTAKADETVAQNTINIHESRYAALLAQVNKEEQSNSDANKSDDNICCLKEETVTVDCQQSTDVAGKIDDNTSKEETMTEDSQESSDVAGKTDDNTSSSKEETMTEDCQESSDVAGITDDTTSSKEETMTEDCQQTSVSAGKLDDNTCSLKEESVVEDSEQNSDVTGKSDDNASFKADTVAEYLPQ